MGYLYNRITTFFSYLFTNRRPKTGVAKPEHKTPAVIDFEENKVRVPWQPMTDPIDLNVTGKFIEECGEAISACARCQVQGIEGVNPTDGMVNCHWLEDEIGDVLAGISRMCKRFKLDSARINERARAKEAFLNKLHPLE